LMSNDVGERTDLHGITQHWETFMRPCIWLLTELNRGLDKTPTAARRALYTMPSIEKSDRKKILWHAQLRSQ